MPHYNIKHVTRYTYSYPVIDCTNQIMLYPIIDGLLEVRNHEINISTDPVIETFVDYFGNHVGVFSIIQPHTSLLIESIADVITKPIIFPIDDVNAAEQWSILRSLKSHTAYIDFLKPEIFASFGEVKSILSGIVNEDITPLKNVTLLSEYVYNNFSYQPGITNVETKLEDVWKMKAGVCQDFAHMLLIFLRMFDMPSRYVSGYVCPKDKEMRGEGATHAWVETFIPNYGWLGIDPTNNCIVDDQHIRLATGRNFADCTPVKGTYKGPGEHSLEVSVKVQNGSAKKTSEKQGLPKFGFQVKSPGEPINSFRYYQEAQQKQQQQQQQ